MNNWTYYKSIILKLLWVVPFFVLLGQTMYLTAMSHQSQQVVIAIGGFDPRSLFSGHYIQYQINWNETDCTQFENGICPKNAFNQIEHRYYLPPQEALQIDRLMSRSQRSDMTFDIVFAYKKGRAPIARMLLINKKEWKQYLKERN